MKFFATAPQGSNMELLWKTGISCLYARAVTIWTKIKFPQVHLWNRKIPQKTWNLPKRTNEKECLYSGVYTQLPGGFRVPRLAALGTADPTFWHSSHLASGLSFDGVSPRIEPFTRGFLDSRAFQARERESVWGEMLGARAWAPGESSPMDEETTKMADEYGSMSCLVSAFLCL